MYKHIQHTVILICLVLLPFAGSKAGDIYSCILGKNYKNSSAHIRLNVMGASPTIKIRSKNFISTRRLSTYKCNARLFVSYYFNGLDGYHADKVNLTSVVKKSSVKDFGRKQLWRKGILPVNYKERRACFEVYGDRSGLKEQQGLMNTHEKESYYIFLSLHSAQLLAFISVSRT